MGLRIGLDFGTSNSGIAVFDGERVQVLPLDPKNMLPEVVKTILYITREYDTSIGQEAIELYYRNYVNWPRRYVKKWAGEIDYFGADLHYVRDIFVYEDELKPGRLLQYIKTALRKSGSQSAYKGTQIFDRYYRVEDQVSLYLGLLKERAEHFLDEKISGVVLGRPVKFSDDPEQDAHAEAILHRAAISAGFDEIQFELEPVAAALYYETSLKGAETALVFDFGGGTLDIAILRLGDRHRREIYASGGIDIAGSDFDRAIIQKRLLPLFGLGAVQHNPEILDLIQAVPDWMALPELSTPINKNHLGKAIRAGIEPVRLKTLQALIINDLAFTFYNQVESAKIALSSQGATVIALQNDDIDLWELYTRAQFEQDIAEYYEQIERVLLDTLAASGLSSQNIDAVVKTGGSSNIPIFTQMLARIFGAEKVKSPNAFSSVTAGLAIRAYYG